MVNRLHRLGILLPLVVFLSFTALGARQSTPELFVYFEDSNLPVVFLNSAGAASNSGIVTVDISALSDQGSRPLKATLPNGRQYDVLLHKIEWRGDSAFKWTGVFVGPEGEVLDAVISVNNEMSAGIIFGEETEFQLVPDSKGHHRLVEIDPGTFSECGGSVPTDEVDDPFPFAPMDVGSGEVPHEQDGNTVIDVLFVYTAEARVAAGGTAQIELILQNAIDFANQAYLNSAVAQEVNLIASGENGYSESGKTSSEMLFEIRSSPTFHALRDAYGADLVALVTSTLESNVGGIGFLMTASNLGSWFAPYGYTVNRLSNLHWTVTHEMGHNMGLNHEPESASLPPEEASYPYAYGHKVEGVFRTIMSYSCSLSYCPRIQYFSNPTLDYSGEPTGVEAERENWQALNNTASVVADFRIRPSCGSLTIPEGLDYPSASLTGECTISWNPVEPNAAKYTLQRSANPSFSGATTLYSGSESFFEQGELSPNSYYYRVRAENCDGFSDWATGPALVVGEAPGLSNVEFSTNLAGNEAEHGQGFLLIGEGTSGSPVTFEFFYSSTPSKPGSPFDTVVRENCSSGCEAFADFTAPSENTTLYFWLEVSSGGDTAHRSLTVQVQGGEPQGLSNVEFSTNLAGNEAVHGQSFLLIGEATSGNPITFLFFSSTTSEKPVSPFDSSTKNHCSGGCDAVADFTAPSENRTLYFWLDVTSGEATVHRSLTVVVESGEDPPPQDPRADLEVLPHVTSRSVRPGHSIELGFKVENDGPSACHNVRLTMTLPESGHVSATEPPCQIGNNVTCDFGTLAAGESETLQVTLTLNEEGTFHSSLSVDGDQVDPDEDDNEAEVEYVVKEAESLFFPYSLRTGSPFPKNPYAGVALLNPNDKPTDVEFIAFDDIGQQLDSVMLSELEGREIIPSMGQTALIPTEIFDLENVSSVMAAGNPHPVKLFFMLGDYNLSTLDGVAGPLPESPTLHFPIARSNDEEEVLLFLVNSNSGASVEATLKLYNGGGVLIAETLRSIQPQGSVVETLKQLFGPTEIDGYVNVSANAKVKGFELYSQSKGLSALVARPVDEKTLLIAPHYFATAGGDTELRLQNLGEKYVYIVVKGYADDGSLLGSYELTLPRRESFARNVSEILPTETTSTEIATGYLIIEITGSFLSTPMVSGSVTFTGFAGNTIATLPLISSGSLKTRFLHVAQSDELNMFTGLAILNLGEGSANVDIKVYDRAGQVVEETSLSDLAPGSRIVDILSGSTFFQAGFHQVGGHMEVVSDKPVVVFALFGDYNGRFLSAIEGQAF